MNTKLSEKEIDEIKMVSIALVRLLHGKLLKYGDNGYKIMRQTAVMIMAMELCSIDDEISRKEDMRDFNKLVSDTLHDMEND